MGNSHFLINRVSSNPVRTDSLNRSLYKSHLAFVNICSGSTLNQHSFNSKIVNAFYSTAEEKSIISFYNLHHSASARSQPWVNPHPISSLAVLSKSTRDIYYVDQFVPKSDENQEQLQIENENFENQIVSEQNPRNENVETENSSLTNDQINEEVQNSRLSGTQLRDYIEKLEKKNPFKEINTTGMRLSPCGKKVLVGYSDEHLKFWEVFKPSNLNKDDLSLSLLSEWR